jgi:hypothetical protein
VLIYKGNHFLFNFQSLKNFPLLFSRAKWGTEWDSFVFSFFSKGLSKIFFREKEVFLFPAEEFKWENNEGRLGMRGLTSFPGGGLAAQTYEPMCIYNYVKNVWGSLELFPWWPSDHLSIPKSKNNIHTNQFHAAFIHDIPLNHYSFCKKLLIQSFSFRWQPWFSGEDVQQILPLEKSVWILSEKRLRFSCRNFFLAPLKVGEKPSGIMLVEKFPFFSSPYG